MQRRASPQSEAAEAGQIPGQIPAQTGQARKSAARAASGGAPSSKRGRAPGSASAEPSSFRAQHSPLEAVTVAAEDGPAGVLRDMAESPLLWLARRKGPDGAPLLAPRLFLAGERLRSEFTRAQMMPRTSANWTASVSDGPRGGGALNFSDAAIAARQRVHAALDAAGPEFAGLLLDVCCFLKRLDEVERERRWPPRSAKVVLQLGLDRLARHYGLDDRAMGRSRASIRTWAAEREFEGSGGEGGAGVGADALDH